MSADSTTTSGQREPHPAFASHFTDAIYDPTRSENDDTLPFGTDDGSDTVSDWIARSDVLQADPRLDVVLGSKATALAREARDDEESGDQLVTAGFILLRAAGTISASDQRLLLKILRQKAETEIEGTYQTMLDDLSSFSPQGAAGPPKQRSAKPRPWLIIEGGWNDAPHRRWLRSIARAIANDEDWRAWWSSAPVERLVLVPRPVGRAGYEAELHDRGRALEVFGTSGELSRLFDQLEKEDPEGNRMDFTGGLHKSHPALPRLFRELILALAQEAARQLDMAAAPATLPPTRR